MLRKFINLCGHQLFLWSVSKIVFFSFLSSTCFGEWVKSSGTFFIDRNTSRAAACENALEKAKQNALKQILGEKLDHDQLEVCTDNNETARCTLYQNTFNYIEGGFISQTKNKKETIIDGEPEKECLITLDVFVKKYHEKPDYNFTLSVQLDHKPRVYEGNALSISGQVSQKAFISVLGWYPDIDKDTYYKIFPNSYVKNNFYTEFFNIPNKEKYKLITKFPKNFDKDETYEFFVVLASKEKFAILENEKVIDFKKRLSIFGRSKWDMKKIGYSIMRN